jgi:dienelactone hydrolase
MTGEPQSEPIKEQALLMGPRRSLVSVISHPPPSRAVADAPTIVLLNSGIVHRVGANRMTVPLARTLAGAGYKVVRLDLSGIGDSEARQDGLGPVEGGLADIKEALDSLQASGRPPRIILGGLCAGADFSVFYAPSDPRVVGTILLEPWMPFTLRHHVYRLASRARHLESWANVVRGTNPIWLALKKRVQERLADRGVQPARRVQPEADGRPSTAARRPGLLGTYERAIDARPDTAERRVLLGGAYARAMDAGCQCLAVLAGEFHHYREQLLDGFPGVRFGERLRLEYLKNADHMFTAQAESRRLIDLVVDWTRRTNFARTSA